MKLRWWVPGARGISLDNASFLGPLKHGQQLAMSNGGSMTKMMVTIEWGMLEFQRIQEMR